MDTRDFIEIKTDAGNLFFLNRNYITGFSCVTRNEEAQTQIQILGEEDPYVFSGDITETIKAGINRVL